MKVADLLSDLTQLQAADAEAALALVSAKPPLATSSNAEQPLPKGDDDDPDLQRAKDLLELHKTVKLAHRDAEPDKALKQARSDVASVMGELQRHV
ncbi:hypothetical protein Slin14017_G037500 [Septoria linicola]|nr:hypothetical protein Slin14017_G037500 [Septoria linicola]